jgi:hypothetical protein
MAGAGLFQSDIDAEQRATVYGTYFVQCVGRTVMTFINQLQSLGNKDELPRSYSSCLSSIG